MNEKKIHQTHFQVPNLPYKQQEYKNKHEAILLLKKIIDLHIEHLDCIEGSCSLIAEIESEFEMNEDLVDWVMKYKGE